MRTLETITDICKLLDARGLTVEQSMQLLGETQQFLALSQRLHETDLDATPKTVLDSAKERIKRINAKSK